VSKYRKGKDMENKFDVVTENYFDSGTRLPEVGCNEKLGM
jgi:hypothetical protein